MRRFCRLWPGLTPETAMNAPADLLYQQAELLDLWDAQNKEAPDA